MPVVVLEMDEARHCSVRRLVMSTAQVARTSLCGLELGVLGGLLTVVLTALILIIFAPQTHDSRWTQVRPYNAKLERMALCETQRNGRARWFLNSGNGYYGGLQFDLSTWRSVGGRGYPHRNSKLEQKFRAVKLIRKRGYRPWPRCGSA